MSSGTESRKESGMRIGKILASFVLLSAVALLGYAADEKKADRQSAGKSPGLEKFKQLAGEWMGKEASGKESGQEVRAIYKVTSAGSAVVETLLPGSEHELKALGRNEVSRQTEGLPLFISGTGFYLHCACRHPYPLASP